MIQICKKNSANYQTFLLLRTLVNYLVNTQNCYVYIVYKKKKTMRVREYFILNTCAYFTLQGFVKKFYFIFYMLFYTNVLITLKHLKF